MSQFSPLIEAVRGIEKYSEKNQFLNVILNHLQSKRSKISAEDRTMLSAFAFEEVKNLIILIPTMKSYKEKDEVFAYEDSLLGIVMNCNASPADIPESNLNDIKALVELVNKERFVENQINDIFESGTNEKADVERLLCMLVPLKDEYQKAQLYLGLLHYQQKIASLPEESKALFSDYICAEFRRYLEIDAPSTEITNSLELLCDVCKYFMNDKIVDCLNDALKLGRSNVNYYAVSSLLCAEQKVPTDVIEALANDTEYAALTYEFLKDHGASGAFPSELATPEYLALSDMVHWLVFPTELGKKPDRIEYLGKVKKREVYYIFRFMSDSDNLDEESKGKWLIGWSSSEGGTFSNFDRYESFEQKTPEKTLKFIRKKLL